MKKLIILFMMILSTLSFTAKKLYVGTNAEFKPYEYLEGDKITGFDIDFMDAIGKEIGYEVHWVNMGFDGLLPALQMKRAPAFLKTESLPIIIILFIDMPQFCHNRSYSSIL